MTKELIIPVPKCNDFICANSIYAADGLDDTLCAECLSEIREMPDHKYFWTVERSIQFEALAACDTQDETKEGVSGLWQSH